MALNFPSSPSTGDVHNASNGLQYHFDGVKWVSQGAYNTSTINTLNFTQTGTGAVSRSVQNKLEDVVSVKDFGAVGNGTTDDTAAIQAAIDYAAANALGATIFLPAGRYLITDAIRVLAGVTLQGDTSGDIYGLHENIAGSPRGTEILLSTTLPTARVWTDIGSAGTAVGTLDTSITYRVGVAAIGKGITIRDLAIQSGGSSDGTGCWDILLFTGAATRFSMENVELRGYTNKAGWYADATWGATQSGGIAPLTQYHIDNYGFTFVPGRNNNEITLKDCMIQAGQWGIYMKGSERTAITSSNSIYSYGGFSDLACFGVRVGNKPTGTAGSYDRNSGSYYRDLIENFQNRYWYGCSFRSTSGNAIYLDRGREEYFIGCYGESRADRVAGIAKTYTVDTLAVVDKIHQGRWDSNNPREHRIYLSQSTRIDPLTDGVGRNVWSAITGSTVTAFSYGFDSSVNHPYISVNDTDYVTPDISATYGRSGTTVTITKSSHNLVSGNSITADFDGGATDGTYTITKVDDNTFTLTDSASGTISTGTALTYKALISAGQVLTQATDAGLGLHLYATDRAEKTFMLGQSSFQYGNPTEHNFISSDTLNISGNFRTEGLETTGAKAYLGAEDLVDINCEHDTQLNFYLNKFLTNGATQSRIRFTTDGLEPYTDLNPNLSLGQSDRQWKDIYFNGNLKDTGTTIGETSTFTPILKGEGTAGTPTYTNQVGYLIKGLTENTLFFRIKISNKGGMAGDLEIDYSAAGVSNPTIASSPNTGGFIPGVISGLTGLSAGDQVIAQTEVGGSIINLKVNQHTGQTDLEASDIADAFEIRFTVKIPKI